MKKQIIIFSLVVFSALSYSQTIRPLESFYQYSDDDNVYFKDVNNILGKFLGTWEYNTADESFKLIITKHVKVQEAPPEVFKQIRFWDVASLEFQYKLKINNSWVTVYDTAVPNMAGLTQSLPFAFYANDSQNLEFAYSEPYSGNCPRNREAELILTYLSQTPAKLEWQRLNAVNYSLDPTEPCPDGTPRDASEFKIPANMVLTKVN